MRVLVTGHHGYIGSVTRTDAAGCRPTSSGWTRSSTAAATSARRKSSAPHLARDVRDVVTPSELEGFDAVVHLAALSNDPRGPQLDWTYSVNRDGTIALARAAKSAGVERFVFASSCSMYGAVDGDTPVDEDAALRPLTPYANRRYARGGGFARACGRRLLARLDAECDRVRRLTASAARHRAQQSRRVGAHDGCDQAVERRLILAPPRSHPRHRSRHLALLDAPAGAWRERRSISAAPSRTTGSATWRRRSSGGCPTARSRSQKTPHPTHAATASTSPSSRHRSPTAASSGRRSEASSSSLTLIPGRS